MCRRRHICELFRTLHELRRCAITKLKVIVKPVLPLPVLNERFSLNQSLAYFALNVIDNVIDNDAIKARFGKLFGRGVIDNIINSKARF